MRILLQMQIYLILPLLCIFIPNAILCKNVQPRIGSLEPF